MVLLIYQKLTRWFVSCVEIMMGRDGMGRDRIGQDGTGWDGTEREQRCHPMETRREKKETEKL
ncbi:hypothetical protein DVH24_031386 [Malus domestica]|uniref:Uncharacterized protein n=1 Tax=Malus domestica TaxID=3750 RepID=A0A498HJB8_MALDO|nr:hypothetical protein DVH24_031386 [Malus domestica]